MNDCDRNSTQGAAHRLEHEQCGTPIQPRCSVLWHRSLTLIVRVHVENTREDEQGGPDHDGHLSVTAAASRFFRTIICSERYTTSNPSSEVKMSTALAKASGRTPDRY